MIEKSSLYFSQKSMTFKKFIRKNLLFLQREGIFFTKDEFLSLPSSFYKTGQIITFSLHPSLEHKKYDIARVFHYMYPDVKTILLGRGVSGPLRKPVSEIIYAAHVPPSTECCHTENGCVFYFDAVKIMFSKGNLEEKKRMSELGRGETVVDMFSGIGYFSIPMAVHSKPEKIIAIEKNPVSYSFLQKNIEKNNVSDIVFPIRGDCMIVTPKNIADRVLMGYVKTTHHYLLSAFSAVKNTGGVIHYHETCPWSLFPERPIEHIMNIAKIANRTAVIQNSRIIKKYSPGVVHVVLDIYVKQAKS